MANSTLVASISQAIARQENANPNYNNPGNLQPQGFTYPGQIDTAANGDAIFATSQDGWNALNRQVQMNINRGLTLQQFFAGGNGYSGYASAGAGNDPATYTANVASWTGIDPNTPLNQISSPFAGSSTQPLIDLSGAASTASTADILSSIQSSVSSVDLTDPTTGVLVLAAAAAAVFFIAR